MRYVLAPALLLALALAASGTHDREAVAAVNGSHKAAASTARVVATPTPEPASSAGCTAEDPRVRPLPRRTVAPPKRPIPFFASRTGALPKDGSATVAGIALGRGSRCAGYWVTDAALKDATQRAAALADAFPRTGLWPVLWTFFDNPDSYAGRPESPSAADGLSPVRILRKGDKSIRTLTAGHRLGARTNPFRTDVPFAALIILVPVNRPSDTLSVLGGFIGTALYSDAELTAVARSYEERYGAVPTDFEPGGVTLAVQQRPRTRAEGLRLAKEHNAFQPDNGDDPKMIGPDLLEKDYWIFGWPD